MGQKTHPIGNRLGITKTWDSRWYLKKGYADQLVEDIAIRKEIKKRLFHAGVSKIEIERAGQKIRLIIHTARPGIIIGKRGSEVEKLRKDIEADMLKIPGLLAEMNKVAEEKPPTPSAQQLNMFEV